MEDALLWPFVYTCFLCNNIVNHKLEFCYNIYETKSYIKREMSYMGNRIYRSNSDKILGGVCAGLAEYLDIDPTIIRIIWAVSFFSGFGFLAYIIAWIVIPQKPYGMETYHNQTYHAPSYPKEPQSEGEEIPAEEVDYNQSNEYTASSKTEPNYTKTPEYNSDRSDKSAKVIGIGLIIIGGGYLAKKLLGFINIDDKLVFSALLIVVGLFLISKKNK